jgi:hypothetical protein
VSQDHSWFISSAHSSYDFEDIGLNNYLPPGLRKPMECFAYKEEA